MRTALLLLVPLLCSCPSMLGGSPPVVFHTQIKGDADVLTDAEHVIVLGEAEGMITARLKGSEFPIWAYEIVNQSGDWTLLDDGEAHHYAFGSVILLPAKSRPMFTAALLAKYPDARFETE